jgi:predicted ferric reductase
MSAYLVAAAAPLLFIVIHDAPGPRGGWHDLSVSLGFIGLAMFGLQFVLSARVRSVTRPFGIDVVVQFHRHISYVAALFVLAHPVLLVFTNAPMARLLNPFTAPWPARFGLMAVVMLVALIATSVWRTRLGLRYETWRLLHAVLAVFILGFSLGHVLLVGYYVSQPWKQVLWVTMSVVAVGFLVHSRIVRPIQLHRRPYRIDKVVERGPETWSVVLRPVGHDGIRFRPGQFAWLMIGEHPWGLEQHPFSFSSSAEEHDGVEMTIKSLGDFTSTIGDLVPGTTAYLDGPYGAFTTELNEAQTFLFAVGGIGITPVMSMLRTLADRGDKRPSTLLYGVSDLDDITFADALAELEGTLDLEVVIVPEEAPEQWSGPRGFIDADLLDHYLPEHRERIQCFVCGPDVMMDAVEQSLHDLGVPPDHVNLERFAFA